MVRAILLAVPLVAVVPLAHGHGYRDPSIQSGAPPAVASEGTSAPNPKQNAARIFFSDRKLITQRGDRVAFYSDVLRDRTVLIHFIFTQCADTCPAQTARVAEVQRLLGERCGRDVALVSISVDPEHDTSEALLDYAARFGAGDGWTFLTGAKADVGDVLRRLAQLTPTRESHTSLFILGNVATGHWIKVHPEAAPAEIARRLRVLADESPSAHH